MIGTCLCENVKLNLNRKDNQVTACYCGMCRKWADGALFSIEGAYLKEDIKFEGEMWIGEYESSEKASRGFCKNCGTSLYYKLKTGQYFFNAGLFDDTDFELVQEYDAQQKPNYLKQVIESIEAKNE